MFVSFSSSIWFQDIYHHVVSTYIHRISKPICFTQTPGRSQQGEILFTMEQQNAIEDLTISKDRKLTATICRVLLDWERGETGDSVNKKCLGSFNLI